MSGRLRRLTAVGGVTALLGGGLAFSFSPAMAVPEVGPQVSVFSGDPDFTGVTTNPETDNQGGVENATMYGAYTPSGGELDGKRVWCIDQGLTQPYEDGYDESGKSDVEAPELAYILAKWDQPRSDQAQEMAYDMAISQHVHSSDEIDHRDILENRTLQQVTESIGWNQDSKNLQAVGENTFESDVLPDAYGLADEMGQEAEKYAGDGTYQAEVTIDGDSSTAQVSLTNSEGLDVPGFTGELTVDGAEVEDTEFTSSTEPVDIPLDFDGDVPKSTIEVEFKGLPTGSVTLWNPKDFKESGYDRENLQSVIEKQTTTVKDSDSYQGQYSPKITSEASTSSIDELPAKITDKGRLESCAPGSTLDGITITAYSKDGRIEQSSDVPEDAEVLETFDIDGVTCGDDGTAEFESDELTLDEDFAQPGEEKSVTFVISGEENELNKAWTHDFGVPEETVTIALPEEKETPTAPKPTEKPTQTPTETPTESPKVNTGAYVDSSGESGANWALISGAGLLIAAAAGGITYLVRRVRG